MTSGFHNLRHFYPSTLIRAGLSPTVSQTRLGHATIAETMDTYGHADQMGRGVVDSVLSGPVLSECAGEVAQ